MLLHLSESVGRLERSVSATTASALTPTQPLTQWAEQPQNGVDVFLHLVLW
jgi:hypothetical protein